MGAMRIFHAGRLAVLAWGALWLAPSALASEKPRIENLSVGENAGKLSVSFRLAGAFSEEVREEIKSGASVSFIHQIQAVRERRWWWDRRVVSVEVKTTVRYDPLTHQYALRRAVDGKKAEERTTDRREEAEAWMTEISAALPLDAGERGAVTLVRARTEVRDRRVWMVIPWDLKTPWESVSFASE